MKQIIIKYFVMVFIFVLCLNSCLNKDYNKIENHLKTAAQAAAQFISAEELDHYHTVEDSNSQSYRELKSRLEQFAKEYNVLYVCYLRQYDYNKFQYIVDNDFDPQTMVGPGTILPIKDIVRTALAENVVTTDLSSYNGSWEGLISGFAPVYDNNGNFYCVASVDISDAIIMKKQLIVSSVMIIFIGIIVILIAVIAIIVIKKQLKKKKTLKEE